MFGTIKPYKKNCTQAQRNEYKKYYCGLCCAMGDLFGNKARLFINYDLTNDFLLTASNNNNVITKTTRCPWSWYRKKIVYYECEGISEYFAKLNYILVYYKLIDNVKDDNSRLSRCIAKKMEKNIMSLGSSMSTESQLLVDYLDRLHYYENENRHLPVFVISEMFGILLEQMVRPNKMSEIDADIFAKINYWVGIWIYTMDAILDCPIDKIKKNYNPITAGIDGEVITIMRARKDELIGILKQCKQNIQSLLELYPTYGNHDLLINLFDFKLPKAICLYLEVEEDELNA